MCSQFSVDITVLRNGLKEENAIRLDINANEECQLQLKYVLFERNNSFKLARPMYKECKIRRDHPANMIVSIDSNIKFYKDDKLYVCIYDITNNSILKVNYVFEDEFTLYRERYSRRSNHFITAHDIVVKGRSKCSSGDHDTEDIRIIVPILDSNRQMRYEKAVAHYCRKCETYFMTTDVFNRLNNSGFIDCPIIDNSTYHKGEEYYDSDFNSLNPESIVHRYGYTVEAKNGLSKNERQFKLEVLIERGLVTTNQVIELLSMLCMLNKKRKSADMSSAICAWETDLKYIEDHMANNYDLRQVGVSKIIR